MESHQLAQVESLCAALYTGTSGQLRTEAQNQLLTLQSSAEFIPQCQFILDNSHQPYAQLLASTSLEALLTQFWNNFTVEQKVEIRNYVLNYLANHAHALSDFVVGSLSKLACRISKLGWFDSVEHRGIVDEITKFLQATVDHHIVGLRVLNALVDEMNVPTTGRTLTHHRKIAVSFRDTSLFQIFQIAITTLRHLQMRTIGGATEEQESKIAALALSLATACLSFDFIGTNPEESSEDVGTVQVPSSWRPVVQDTLTLQLFFDFYRTSVPPSSSKSLEAIVQLSSIRRSLFVVEKERTVFLDFLMKNIQDIMRTKKGLEHVDNYHEFCRLLARMKASYQLSELVKTPGFIEWLQLCGDFTIKSLQNWQYSMNSIHYLLALWGRLVAALPYLRPDASEGQVHAQVLRQCVLQVVQSYIETMLASVDIVVAADGGVDDPLEDEGSIKEQMERLPVLARLQFDTIAQFLNSVFEQTMKLYEQSLASHNRTQIDISEGRLTWLCLMVGAVIGTQSSELRKGNSDQVWDGQLSRHVFQLVQVLNYRQTNSSGQSSCDEKLELALVEFFKSFKRAYLMDGNGGSFVSSMMGSSMSSSSQSAHPLLSLALSSFSGENKDSVEALSVFDVMGLGDVNSVMNLIVTKICNNIKYWGRSSEILEQSLELFVDLVSTYTSSKTLLGLETVHFMVHNHTGMHFPFLGYDNDNKFRITFYTALSRLVFTAAEDLNNSFDAFVAPNVAIIEQLNQTKDLSDNSAKLALVGAFRDLRGISSATHSKRTYNLLFDVLYPTCFDLLNRVAEIWSADPTVMTACLKFLQDFVHNKNQRIVFDQSSANGILLFRETSAIVCTYGSRLLQLPVVQNIYVEKYKGIRLILEVLTASLCGNYVNFGVFSLYNDKALQNAMDVALQMCLQIPLSDIVAYVKLSKAFYAFLEILFRNHLDVLCGLDSPVFLQLVKTIYEGLQSNDLTICSLCASSVDHIMTYIFLNQRREKPTVQIIRAHMNYDREILPSLMTTLFNAILFASHSNLWAVTRPILSLMLASESSFNNYREQLIASQPPEMQGKLREEFDKLTQDIQVSLETTNRDKFTQRLTQFRLNVRQFLTL